MKTKIYMSIFLGFVVSMPLFSQNFNPKTINKNQLIPKQAFSLQDYKLQSEMRSDTIWLPRRQDIYLWNGEELEMEPFYHLLFYESPDELTTLITMDSFTDDSLLMANYEYDEQSRAISEVYNIYDTVNMGWKIDYKAIRTYDEFGCVNRTLVQAWDTETGIWHDSIAEVIIWVDTNEPIDRIIEEYINHEWVKLFGYQWVYYYTPEQYVYEQYNYKWDTETEEYVYDVRAEFSLNDDGSWYESVWYKWDDNSEEWIYIQKYTELEWAYYNKYPNNYKNKLTHRVIHWWTGDEWYAYLKDDWEYPSPDLDDKTRHAYYWDDESEQWYLSNYYTSRHYTYGWKKRYTDSLRNSIHEEMKLNYDDSCRWYFYKEALEEMFRVSYDTAQAEWLPAARLLYSDFIPFVDNTAIDDIEPQEEKLKIIPNPSKNLVEIENNHHISEVSLFDSKGICVLHFTEQLHNPKITIDVSGLPAGIYIIKAATKENRLITDKLIVN